METAEFDATLGGTEHLPYAANSFKFTVSRSVEIAALTESILKPSKNKLVFQSLPVHMRRRVMSHNSKRLPRRLQKAHLEQVKKSGPLPTQKRPSRKFRRRPANLLDEYNRRQQRSVWLETHIWHAKRFHMTERWGHRLPYAPCDKAFRACYRGSSAHCLMQDISYYIPIQIKGALDTIREMFAKITSSLCGLGISAKAYVNGTRQGNIHLYGINTYPFNYIGKVQFLWVPSDTDDKNLWLFVHPSQVKEVESILLDLIPDKDIEKEGSIKKRRKLVNVEIKTMHNCFNRFRLTGPNSHAILVQSLKCINANYDLENSKWMSIHKPLYLEEKEEYWDTLVKAGSPAQLPPNLVVGLVVQDPRLSRPWKRTKAKLPTDSFITTNTLLTVPSFLSNSPLWDVNIHKAIKEKIMSNGQYIKHVTETQLVPGEVNEDDSALQSIPIVLVQRPGSQNSEYKKIGYGSGWDVIVPSGYALPFWLTFIMFGARSGGLRETESVTFESGECYLPPDSNAGKENEMRIEQELRDKYFRLPPSKRINYIKIGTNSPFICPWNILLSDWSNQEINNYFILRNRSLLNDIQDCITRKKALPKIENDTSCLVPVYIKLVGKGSLKNHAHICLPESHDLNNIKTLFEPHHEDPNEKIRKLNRTAHITMLKQLRKRNMRLRKKRTQISQKKTPKYVRRQPSEYVIRTRELWLPSKIKTVRNIASRQVMGYISQGAFSFTEACSCGIGYIAYNALNTLLSSKFNQVLVRNTSSRKYRLANIIIIQNT
ncbi:unnamed protein product [Chrysodeixis includens]|uniref:Uncharacterized protein n=1 Tax=Chrysodeixis includens TaxID=689277 RepID=A0A9N8KXB9_CHRIL|nr:unnamed protein product [Chrysodeixis includens]